MDSNYGGSLEATLATPTLRLREELLNLKGIGAETADSILLYAGHHPIFVVDAYTRRVLERHDIVLESATYDEIRALIEAALQAELPQHSKTSDALDANRPVVHTPSAMSRAPRGPEAKIYNEMHGLFVQLGKHYCVKAAPRCHSCPLQSMLPATSELAADSRAGGKRRATTRKD